MKKYIFTEEIKKYKHYEKLLYLSPLFWFLFGFRTFIRDYSAIRSYNNPELRNIYLIVYFATAIALSIPMILIGLTVIRRKRLSAIENATFSSVSGLDYHRDKLEGVSPVEISYLTDLELEEKKDITGQILQYELWGVLDYEDGDITIKNLNDERLKERDKILINLLENKSSNFSTWRQKCYEDMTKSQYFDETEDGKPKLLKLANRLALIMLVLFGVFAFFTVTGQIDSYMDLLDNFSEVGKKNLSNLVITREQMYVLIAFIILICLIFGLFATSLGLSILHVKNTKKGNKLLRTNEGNIKTEYIYGLKNFISDFTLLSDREKKELVLWDDFLIYAVVLEENKNVIDEIFDYRGEKSLENTFNKINSNLKERKWVSM